MPPDDPGRSPLRKLLALGRGFLIAVLSVAVLGMMATTAVDVIGRYGFNSPFGGAKEMTEVFLALMVFGAAPLVTLGKMHATTGLFESLLKGPVLRVRDAVVALLGCVWCSILSWRLWLQGDETRAINGGTQFLHVPLAPIFYMLAILAGVCAVLVLVPVFTSPEQNNK